MSNKDYYEILGVDRNASQQDVRDAYRKMAFRYHPDKNGDDPDAVQKMKDINEAYAVLSDPAKRQQYDLLGSRYGSAAYDRFRQSYSAEDIFRGSDIDQVLNELARMFGFRNAGDIFREAYGTQFRGFGSQQPGKRGGTGDQYNTGSRVPDMQFRGVFGKMMKFALKTLTGVEIPERGEDRLYTISLGPETARDGGEVKYSYREWGHSRNLMVKVPAGIKDGQRIRLKGMGMPGKAGGESGDLYLKVKISKPLSRRLKDLFKGKDSG